MLAKAKSLRLLGWKSLARVGLYRIGLKTGFHPVQRLAPAAFPGGPFFLPVEGAGDHALLADRCEPILYFDHLPVHTGENGKLDFHANPLTQLTADPQMDPWWKIEDFDCGDIKGVWELSRLGWMVPLAAGAAKESSRDLSLLEEHLNDWGAANPPYLGRNWKCGQEASLRVLHLACVLAILQQDSDPLPAFVDLVDLHLKRIAPTVGYALGQDNNHGTSEASALFVGGAILSRAGRRVGASYQRQGRKMLENRARTLVMPDGSFSQYSTNYHRLMLDALWFCEFWRRRHDLAPFSATLTKRMAAASRWLRVMMDDASGDVPVIGASDGARIFPLRAGEYRDYRPTVQIACSLFCGQRALPSGSWDDLASALHIELPDQVMGQPTGRTFDDGGWHVIRTDKAVAVMRFPRFDFRPSHADALHFDLSVDGTNFLRDAGTFSYNADTMADGDFAATRFHNTVEFDRSDQMPRVSRFLFGDWLKPHGVEPVAESENGGFTCAAGYRDNRGNAHHRRIAMQDGSIDCTDILSGEFREAVLRWRLAPGEWTVTDNRLTGGSFSIDLSADADIQARLTKGLEARHYGKLGEIDVLEVRLTKPCTILSEIRYRPCA